MILPESNILAANLCVDPAEQEPMGERHVAVQQSRVAALVDAGCLPPFLSLIRSADADAVRLGLQFTEVVRRGVGSCGVVGRVCEGVRCGALVDAGCLPPFLSLIRSADADAGRFGLQFTEVVRSGAGRYGVVMRDKRGLRLVEEADGIDAIEAAQFVGNEELHSMSSYLSARPWMPVVVLSDCRPPPNLFHCNRLVHRDGPAWLFNLTVADMRRRLQPVGNCALATPEPQLLPGQLTDQQPAAARRLAYATVLHSKEDYVCGAIALANSLQRSGTRAELVALVSAEIGNFSRGGLEAAGWRLIEIERIRNPFGRAGTYNQWNYR
ncbi:unnamed protein product [Closterium sp. Naga37s-1]|nr:unnamed protein product [Closterium sp. Naga37s-1]